MAFDTCTFEYDGVSCEEYGLMYYEIDGNSQSDGVINEGFSPVSDHVARRFRPIHYGVEKSDHMEFDMVFGSLEPLDRVDIGNIARWLTGRNYYAPLIIHQDDMYGIQYKVIFTDMQIIDIDGIPYAFSAHAICDGPFAYTEPLSQAFQCGSVLTTYFNNISNVPEMYAPDLRIELASGSNFMLRNITTGETFSLEFDGANTEDITIYIGGDTKVLRFESNDMSSLSLNLYRYMKLNGERHFVFPRFAQGENEIEITGDCTLHIDSEFPMQIGY